MTAVIVVAVIAAFALLYVVAGRRERAEARRLQALREELETAEPGRAREIRRELGKHSRRRSEVRREVKHWRLDRD